jgi:hypothetical protein
MTRALEKSHTPIFSHELGTKTVVPNTSATNGFSCRHLHYTVDRL